MAAKTLQRLAFNKARREFKNKLFMVKESKIEVKLCAQERPQQGTYVLKCRLTKLRSSGNCP
jgi:hypothetical protein